MEKNSYTEMFQRVKQKSEKQNNQLIDSIKKTLLKKNVNEIIQSRILYSHFSKPANASIRTQMIQHGRSI